MALPVRRTHERSEVAGRSSGGQPDRTSRPRSGLLGPWPGLPTLLGDAFVPLADVEETGEAYLVEIELPGIDRDDIDIEVSANRVTVHGERKQRQRVGILRRQERTVGQFHYDVTLPGEVDADGVSASLDEGVLTVRLPKPAAARPRRIEVR